tara:strand:+ start:316 stop:900 length:585 start_codon:yes stop_codon:yes gene_type:complete
LYTTGDNNVITDDDRAVVENVINGNIDDFALLVGKYQLRIINLCLRYTKNYHDAEEVAQESFIRAYKSLPSFRFDSKFYSWLHRIAVNCSLNYINSKEKMKEKETITENNGLTDTRTSDDNPDDYYDLEELSKKMNKVFESLSSELRDIVIMSDIEGLSYEEISHKIEIPIGTVRSRLHRARDLMVRVIKDKIK